MLCDSQVLMEVPLGGLGEWLGDLAENETPLSAISAAQPIFRGRLWRIAVRTHLDGERAVCPRISQNPPPEHPLIEHVVAPRTQKLCSPSRTVFRLPVDEVHCTVVGTDSHPEQCMGIFDRFSRRNDSPSGPSNPQEVIVCGTRAIGRKSDWAWVNEAARDAFERGMSSFRSGNSQQAAAEYAAAIKAEPTWGHPYCELGSILSDCGQLEKAIELLQKSISLDPNWPLSYYNLGNSLKQQGQLGRALDAFRKYTTLAPSDPDGHLAAASIYMRTGKTDEENQAYERALVADERCVVAHVNLGINHLNARRVEPARYHLGQARKFAPQGSKEQKIAEANLALLS